MRNVKSRRFFETISECINTINGGVVPKCRPFELWIYDEMNAEHTKHTRNAKTIKVEKMKESMLRELHVEKDHE